MNLGVTFDSELSFGHNTKKLVQQGFYQLRNIFKIGEVLSLSNKEKMIIDMPCLSASVPEM